MLLAPQRIVIQSDHDPLLKLVQPRAREARAFELSY